MKEDFKIFAVNVDYNYYETVIKIALKDWNLKTFVYDGEYGMIKKRTMKYIFDKIKEFAKQSAGDDLESSPLLVKYFIIHIIVRAYKKKGSNLDDSDLRNIFDHFLP